MPGVLNILAASISSAISDGYFNRVTLLLPGNGTNGAQNNTFLDSSSNNFSITRNGNTTQGNFSPFSQTGWSGYFDGSSNLVASSNAVAATGAFTIEAFVYITGTASAQAIVSQYLAATSGRWGIYWNDTANKFSWSCATGQTVVSDSTYTPNAWYHIVVQRDASNVLSLYVNGVRNASTVTESASLYTGATYIANRNGGGTALTGYISNLRITNTAVYSGTTLTVPTSPLTAVSGTTLLTLQSYRFVDNSSNAYTFTLTGTPSIQSFSPFAPTAAYSASAVGGSGYFDGTGDYLSVTNAALVAAGDFTVEAFVYVTQTGAYQGFVSTADSADADGFRLSVTNTNNAEFWIDGSSNAATPLVPNQWNHMAMARSGSGSNNVSCYLNGTRVAQLTVTTSTTNTTLALGRYRYNSDANYIKGYISGARYIVGSAIYSGTTITVPTAPPTAVASTALLLNFTNGGIVDATSKNDLETVGNAQISTAQSKFGGSSMYFDGNGDFLQGQNTNYLFGSGNFTVEGWIYPSGTTGLQYIASVWGISGQSDATYSSWVLRLNAANLEVVLQPTGGGGLTTITGTGSGITANTWQYVAVVRNGSTVTLYINGSSVGSGTFSATLNSPVSVFAIGAQLSNNNTFNGYIDDLRITRYARTISASPTAAFPVQ